MNISFENLAKLKLLLSIDHIGPSRVLKLTSKFDSLDKIFTASSEEIASIESFNKHLSSSIITNFHRLDNIKRELEEELAYLDKLDCKLISYWDDEYPANLKKIYFPPLILYIKGKLTKEDIYSISIVGTRMPSEYGRSKAKLFSQLLAEQGLTIVSGLARGIDSIAHKSALKSRGRTIAVIGSGIDVVYPPENRKLFDEISEKGAVISEFEPRTKPDAPNFPRRNRIISGLSLGTLIVETRLIGGAMQTASHALDQNREVFAIPGSIDSKQSEGANSLIKKGEAKLVMNIEDILDELNLPSRNRKTKTLPEDYNLNLFEQTIVKNLSFDPKHIDVISDNSDMSTPECLVHLLNLEIKGVVRQLPGKNFILS